MGALLLYGREATDWPGRALNRTLRGSVGATNKRPVDKLCCVDSFARAGLPPDELLPLLEAARSAPSASNAQPWRFLWRQGVLHLYVTRRNLRYGLGPTQNYRLYDGGICMANVALALRAMGRAGKWQLHTDAAPMHPDTLELECWKQGSRFSLVTGEPSVLPATKPTPVYELRLEGDDVMVVLP